MNFVVPYIDKNKQVIFVEFEDDLIHEVANGFIFGLFFWGFLSLAILYIYVGGVP